MERLATSEGEQPARQVGTAPSRLLDAMDKPGAPRGILGSLQELCAAGDHSQQVVEIVCDAAGELADRLELLDLEQAQLRILSGSDLLVDTPLEVSIQRGESRIGFVQLGGALA